MNIVMRSIIALCFVIPLTVGIAHAELPQINDARLVQPPPGAKVAAAYFTIDNTSTETLVITGVSSNTDMHTEIHLSSVVDDVARMQKQDSVEIPAGASLAFKHGSYHIMLMGISEPIAAGSELLLTLQTSAGELPVVVPVITPDEASTMKKMNHEQMDKK